MIKIRDYKTFSAEDYEKLIMQILPIEDNKIDDELKKQPVIYSYYSQFVPLTHKDLSDLEIERDSWIADTRLNYKASAIKAGAKVTEGDKTDYIQAHETYKEYSKAINEQKERCELFKKLLSALEQRHSCLIQISSNNRAETKLYS